MPSSWAGCPCGACAHPHCLAVGRGLAEGWRGWTVAMKAGAQWAELAGHDYVLDLVSDLELLRGFPRQKSCFLIAWDGTESHSRDSRP